MPETNHGKKQNPRGKREIFALMKMCENITTQKRHLHHKNERSNERANAQTHI